MRPNSKASLLSILKSDSEIWDLFTKKEEYDSHRLDEHQRFCYSFSRVRDPWDPRVSGFLIRKGLDVFYPDKRRFAICLTHDIDFVRYPLRKMGYELYRTLCKRRFKRSLKILLSRLSKGLNYLSDFSQIIEMERKYGAKSSFYFLALERGDFDFNFKIEELKDDLRIIVGSGWEVGLHGGYEAYDSIKRIKEEKRRLETVIGREVLGCRNHYLRFRIPQTWEILKAAGFKYDTTFGYVDHIGFRNGICHPFIPYNLSSSKPVDILEIPLTIADFTLDNYMQLDWNSAWELVKTLIDVTKRYNGVITILWHNTYMVDESLEFYEKILQYGEQQNAWMTSAEEIWRWWRDNNFFNFYE